MFGGAQEGVAGGGGGGGATFAVIAGASGHMYRVFYYTCSKKYCFGFVYK